MRGSRVKQIRKAYRLMTGEGISKLELKKLKRDYNALRRGSQSSQLVTSGYFQARLKCRRRRKDCSTVRRGSA